jgi:hypothetical protein
MTVGLPLTGLTLPEFALRLFAMRGTAAYAADIVEGAELSEVLTELGEELAALDPAIRIAVLDGARNGSLLLEQMDVSDEMILVNAGSYHEDDWSLLDRQRSSLAHSGVMVFVTTRNSFEHLMRVAPNLASWLGALVFQHAREDAHLLDEARVRRLSALRSWAGQTDEEVVLAASQGRLPADPEYAEWLVLLGRGDLLDGHAP